MTTAEECTDLHEQAAQLCYLAIRYTDLSPLLTCDEWDALAASVGAEVVELILRRVDDVKEAKEVEDAKLDEWLASA